MRLQVLTQKYTCGGCTVCCEVMAAQELAKPFYARCEHTAEKGCGAYDDRPQCCRDFVCSWAAGLMGDNPSWRPDQSGLLFFMRRYEDGMWLEIYEAAAGAASDASRVEYLTQRIISRVQKIERIVGTRLHHFADRIGLGFAPDEGKYPAGKGLGGKMNRYGWIGRDPTRQVFQESHDPPG